MSQRSKRKEDHLRLAQQFFKENNDGSDKTWLNQVHLIRPALPESQVDPSVIRTQLFGHEISAPFFIEAMTGGSKASKKINQELGQTARQTNIPLALGSASILVNEPEQLASFLVAREEDPDGLLLANVNPRTPAKKTKEIVSELKADAVQIHLNAVQEAAMTEGERDFHWLDNMLEIREQVTCPLIVKEVGFGFDANSLQLLQENGFNLFDLAGSGGTNFAQIEDGRNPLDVSYLTDIGLPTALTTLIAQKLKLNYFVSGGIKDAMGIFKSLAMGGKLVGIAGTFLYLLEEQGVDKLIAVIEEWKQQLAVLFALYGKEKLADLTKIPRYYDLELKNVLEQLEIK